MNCCMCGGSDTLKWCGVCRHVFCRWCRRKWFSRTWAALKERLGQPLMCGGVHG